jgi:FtsP/CotA-like multicopper oxidase with cupredoxin domain
VFLYVVSFESLTYPIRLAIMKLPLLGLLGLTLLGCKNTAEDENSTDIAYLRSQITVCGGTPTNYTTARLFPFGSFTDSDIDIDHPRYLPAGKSSGLPLIVANDNTIPAGKGNKNSVDLDLEVKWGDFRMETPDRPGLKLVAIGEVGKPASIPAPLIRVAEETIINARIKNTLTDSSITVYGLQNRPFTVRDSLFILPGESGAVSFNAGSAGTFLYWIKLGEGNKKEGLNTQEDEQLAGAFIIDPKGGSPKDRVFVMNIFSSRKDNDNGPPLWMESLTINGRSWPFTERVKPSVGDTINWRVINASDRNHPMHLHGFYYNVLERGKMNSSNIYEKADIPLVVTETMRGRTTMAMQWIPKRPGNWLFHCHLSFHVTADIRLPGASNKDPEGAQQHMAGLVIGIEVNDGGTDLFSKGEPLNMTLHANEQDDNIASYGLENKKPSPGFRPGAPLILKQYQTTNITLKNHMSLPTSVHWHGLEIDSWSDGVPNWSASDGRSSPIIEPGEEFTYKLSLMRAGTFVYHSHLDDIHQLTKGLYGPLIVIGENEIYNPDLDHYYILGWKNPDADSQEELDLNGWDEVPIQKAKVGETHRLRYINIGPAGNARMSVTRDGKIIPLKIIAKDGAELPFSQQKYVDETARIFVGETADFEFSPMEPGNYVIEFKYIMARWKQSWVISAN